MSAKHNRRRAQHADTVVDLSRREFLAGAAVGGVAAIGAVTAAAATPPPPAQEEPLPSEHSARRELALLGQYGGEFGDLRHAGDTAQD